MFTKCVYKITTCSKNVYIDISILEILWKATFTIISFPYGSEPPPFTIPKAEPLGKIQPSGSPLLLYDKGFSLLQKDYDISPTEILSLLIGFSDIFILCIRYTNELCRTTA